MFSQIEFAPPSAQFGVVRFQVSAPSDALLVSSGSHVKVKPVAGAVKTRSVVKVYAPTVTVTVLVSAFLDLTVKVAAPLPSVVP